MVKELGVVKLLGNALLAFPETNPEELKLLKGSKESCNKIRKDNLMQKKNEKMNNSKADQLTPGVLLLKAANASSLLKRLLASAGETEGLLKGSSEEDSRPFCIVGERALGASGLGGLLGLSSTEKSGSEKVYLIGSRYISGTF